MIILLAVGGVLLVVLMYSCLAMSSIQDDLGAQEMIMLIQQEEKKLKSDHEEPILKNM